MRYFLFFISGITLGFWFSWPGIFNPNNWVCFNDIIDKSLEEKISVKAVLSVSPIYLLKGNNNKMASKLRVVSDACFR